MAKMVVHKPFQRLALTAGELRMDRLLDEARYSSDPIQLIRLFGISVGSATMYVASAHPDKGADPIKP